MNGSPSVALQRIDHTERSVLEGLIDEYLGELNRHREVPAGPVDAASYEYLPLYWEEVGRHPLWVVARSTRVGFVLIREVEKESIIEMSEFYIRRVSRCSGVGRAALAEVWRRFPGSWRLQVHARNEAAVAFWPRCIEAFASGDVQVREVTEEDGRRLEYSFEIAEAGAAADR